ncbi:MAG: DinB family protein [Phycisphaeraceae bacterium]
MSTIDTRRVVDAMLRMLSEAFEGCDGWTWFISHDVPDAALFAALANLTPEQASTPAAPGGRSIAAHVEHLRWALHFASTFLQGDTPDRNWDNSWTVQVVDKKQWRDLQAALREQYETLRDLIDTREDWSDDVLFRGTMAQLPHTAYHLGAIRQLVRVVM